VDAGLADILAMAMTAAPEDSEYTYFLVPS
jgi:hypothetical protein